LFFIIEVIHTLGHIYNLESFVVARDAKKSDKIPEAEDLGGLLSILSHLGHDVYLNPVKTDNSLPIVETIKMLPGTTGVLMCLCLCVIASTSSEIVRRSFFNLFWYTHQLMASSFFIFFIVHGLQKVVRKQTNTNRNNPEKCYKTWSSWPEPGVCDLPEFDGNMATSWIWVIVPVLIYSLERLLRFIRSLRQYDIESYKFHPSNVLELIIDNTNPRKMFKYKSGQYVYLNVQEISYFEWHPFTSKTNFG
jgi:NADPH oxidase 2